jgi:hypothetical protein
MCSCGSPAAMLAGRQVRNWAKQLGISHTWLQKVVRALKANPEEMRRLQSQGDVTLAQLDRAKESTQRMRERGQLRLRDQRKQRG